MLLLCVSPGETWVANLEKNITASDLKISEHVSLLSKVIMKNVKLAGQKLVMVFTILSTRHIVAEGAIQG